MFPIYDSHGHLIETHPSAEKTTFVTSYEFIELCYSVLPDVIAHVSSQVPHLNIGNVDIRRGRELYLKLSQVPNTGEIPVDIEWYADTLKVLYQWCLRWHLNGDRVVDEDLAYHEFHIAQATIHCRSLDRIEPLALESMFYIIYRNVCHATDLYRPAAATRKRVR